MVVGKREDKPTTPLTSCQKMGGKAHGQSSPQGVVSPNWAEVSELVTCICGLLEAFQSGKNRILSLSLETKDLGWSYQKVCGMGVCSLWTFLRFSSWSQTYKKTGAFNSQTELLI